MVNYQKDMLLTIKFFATQFIGNLKHGYRWAFKLPVLKLHPDDLLFICNFPIQSYNILFKVMVKSPNSSLSSFDKVESTSRSSASSGSDENQKQSKKKNSYSLIIGGIFTLIGAYIANTFTHPPINFENVQFDFYVHCPVSYELKHLQENYTLEKIKDNRFSTLRNLREKYKEKLNNTFVVRMEAMVELQTDESSSEKELRLKYCSFSRPWDGNCQQNATYVCSNPGPAFDVNENQNITVFWVNNIDLSELEEATQAALDKDQNQCYFNNLTKHYDVCIKKGKTKGWQNLTYLDPTDIGGCSMNCETSKTSQSSDCTQKVHSKRKQVPTSTHVHGLEVRPLFDGNPLSWFDRNNDNVKDSHLGTGFMSADDPYFDFLTNQHEFSEFQRYLRIKNSPQKVNMYPNKQQPGTLWYHDHAMGVTSMNVRLGLTSFYIIRNQKSQEHLPKGQFEKLVYIYEGFNNSEIKLDCNQYCTNETSQNCRLCKQGELNGTDDNDNDIVKSNSTYRFRVLNGDFAGHYANVIFQCVSSTKVNLTLNLTVIGTDSAMKRYPVQTSSLSLASAERADVLVSFKPCVEQNYDYAAIRLNDGKGLLRKFHFENNNESNYSPVSQIQVPFVNLSQSKYDDMVVAKRMRPLVAQFGDSSVSYINKYNEKIPSTAFGINGHLRFHTGASQNPKIGTIEDWYLINTIGFGHPIHIHLIQFQIMDYYRLRTTNNDCTYYVLDFFKKQASQYTDLDPSVTDPQARTIAENISQETNYTQLCITVQAVNTKNYMEIFETFKNDHIINDTTKISGIDVDEKSTTEDEVEIYNTTQECENKYKECQIAQDDLKDYQKGWKDTVWVDTFTVARVRIRWASTDMTQEQFADPVKACRKGYFRIPEQDLIEFPGFLYHCHILRHEDNQMMRPIMMQPSDCNNTLPWKDKWKDINCEILEQKKSSKTNDLRMR